MNTCLYVGEIGLLFLPFCVCGSWARIKKKLMLSVSVEGHCESTEGSGVFLGLRGSKGACRCSHLEVSKACHLLKSPEELKKCAWSLTYLPESQCMWVGLEHLPYFKAPHCWDLDVVLGFGSILVTILPGVLAYTVGYHLPDTQEKTAGWPKNSPKPRECKGNSLYKQTFWVLR